MKLKQLFWFSFLIFLSSCGTTHKTTRIDNKDWAKFRNEWINMDENQFAKYVLNNKKIFYQAPYQIKVEAQNKWYALYPNKGYPLGDVSKAEKKGQDFKKSHKTSGKKLFDFMSATYIIFELIRVILLIF